MVVNGDLNLTDKGWSSGGYMADVHVTGAINAGGQQQWFTRNSSMSRWNGGQWNMVFTGSVNAPGTTCGKYTNIPSTPIIVEKSYIISDDGYTYKLMRPRVEHNKVGTTKNWQNADEIDFSKVYVAHEGDSAATINQKLNEGLHLIL